MARMASMFVIAAVVAASGCTTFGTWNSNKPLADAAAEFPPPATVAVELHPHNSSPKSIDVPLEEGMTVQDALKKTGAHRKYRRAYIDLKRTPKGEVPHTMGIEFKDGQVGHSSNYDLHPNDRIIVTQDTRTFIDDTIAKYIPSAGAKKKKR